MKTKKMTLSHKAIIYADSSDNKLSCWNAMCVTAEFLRTNYCIRIGAGKWIVEDASGGEWTFKECGEKGFILDTSPLNPGDTTFLHMDVISGQQGHNSRPVRAIISGQS